jgi:hypothetical protein
VVLVTVSVLAGRVRDRCVVAGGGDGGDQAVCGSWACWLWRGGEAGEGLAPAFPGFGWEPGGGALRAVGLAGVEGVQDALVADAGAGQDVAEGDACRGHAGQDGGERAVRHTYNTLRPHQALDERTPRAAYLAAGHCD